MNAIQKAMDEVQFRLPPQILETVFTKRSAYYRAQAGSITDHIMSCVVRPRVLVDCSLAGGTEAFITLNDLNPERTNDYTQIYRIPKERTQGRSIMSVLNITFADPNRSSSYGASATQGSSALLQLGQSVIDAHLPVPTSSTAYVQLISENTVLVRDTAALPGNIFLRCILANDENLSHIQLKSYRHFTKLVELAVKAYIWNMYEITMGSAELSGGMDLGVFKSRIEKWEDSEELYQTYLVEKWDKVALMNDRESWTRFMKGVVGGPH